MFTRPLSVVRRWIASMALVALGLASLGVASAPAQAADSRSIDVFVQNPGGGRLVLYAVAGADLSPFAEGELLVVQKIDGGVRLFIDEGSARLVSSDRLCKGSTGGLAVTTIECRFDGPFTVDWYVSLQFGAASVATAVAVEENSMIDTTFIGGSGRDEFYGGPGSDLAQGGLGNDTLFGGPGDDDLYGEEGDDYLEGEGGDDAHFGGSGDNLIDSEDGRRDRVVNCGGTKPSEGPFYDLNLDVPVSCLGTVPPRPAPAPIQPEIPPAPGEGQYRTPSGDWAPAELEPLLEPGVFQFTTPTLPLVTVISSPTPTPPTVPVVNPTDPLRLSTVPPSTGGRSFEPGSAGRVILFSEPLPVGEFIVGDDGSWSTDVEVPPSVPPGDHTLQVTGTSRDGEALVYNIGIEVQQDVTPTLLISGSRGEGKEIRRVFVAGESTHLVGQQVAPRFKLPGQTQWQIGQARRTIGEDGTFAWRRITGKKISITFAAGELISNRIVIASKRDTLAER